MTLEELTDQIDARIRMDDKSPEEGHASIDAILESVMREIADGNNNAVEMAVRCVALLDLEESENWARWYA